ncbi:hypothetical protein JG688_00014276, partial [Phytophthora aleatoria]
AFVAGDPRGHRTSVVLRIDQDNDAEYPISVDSGERKLRTYSLIPGQCVAPTRSSAFNLALPASIRSAIEATMREHRRRCEDIVPESSQLEEDRDKLVVAPDINAGASSNATLDDSVTKGEDIYLAAMQMVELSEAESAPQEKLSSISHADVNRCDAVGDVVSTGNDPTVCGKIAVTAAASEPTDQEVIDAGEYMRNIPN